jgi:hydroxyacylglutathione hydrolase
MRQEAFAMLFRQITDPKLAQYAYLIGCQRTGEAVVFDPERDVDQYVQIAAKEGLRIVAVAETHIHADFLSGARELAERVGAHVYVGCEGGPDWQSKWVAPYAHTLLKDGDTFKVGNIVFQAMHTPGHTPEHVSYLVTDVGGGASAPMGIISGDFVFVGDLGRPDLLESAAGLQGVADSSAHALWRSASKFVKLPGHLQVWPAHGAGSACGKALGAIPQSTVGYEVANSPALKLVGNEAAFVKDILSGQPEPPVYFARMKALNRDGVPVLGALPKPEVVTDLKSRAAEFERPGTVVVDLRPWAAFRDGHLPGALHSPAGKMLPMVVGSYVKPEERIALVCDPAMAEEIIRDLVRIGYDHYVAVIPPAVVATAPKLEKTPEITVQELETAARAGAFVLDVRGASEHELGGVAGSTNIAYTRLAPRLAEVPRGGRVLVHCALGGRSAAATAMLRRLGHDAVNVAGGFEAWKKAGLPVATPTKGGCGSCCGGTCKSTSGAGAAAAHA